MSSSDKEKKAFSKIILVFRSWQKSDLIGSQTLSLDLPNLHKTSKRVIRIEQINKSRFIWSEERTRLKKSDGSRIECEHAEIVQLLDRMMSDYNLNDSQQQKYDDFVNYLMEIKNA